MKKIAIILEDMRIEVQNNYLILKELLKTKKKNSYTLFVPKNSKTILSLFFNIKKIKL